MRQPLIAQVLEAFRCPRHRGGMTIRTFAPLAISMLAALSGCVPAPEPISSPPLRADPAPAAPLPPPLPADWTKWPVAAGDWSYRATTATTTATFGAPGQPALLGIQCDMASKTVSVTRVSGLPQDQIAGQMTVHTSFGDAHWPVAASQPNMAGTVYAVATRANNDAALDRISFSRGRIAVKAPGAQPIAVPNWAEISRVIEDCRG